MSRIFTRLTPSFKETRLLSGRGSETQMSLSNRKISSLRAVLLCLLAIGLSDPLFSQQPVPMSKDYAQWGCDFLQSLYPNVGIDKLVGTLEASNSFRNKAIFTRYFNLYVGEGEHGRTLGYIG